jgi:hypothetical protein
MHNPDPCPKCGRLFVWDGTRCVHQQCRFGSTQKPLEPPKKLAPIVPPSFAVRWKSVSPIGDVAITRLLKTLERNEYGWQVLLPVEFGNFFGSQVAIEFQTREIPNRRPPPAVSEGEKELARDILLRLREVLREAERRFKRYNAGTDPPATSLVSRPHIWIQRGEIGVAHPRRWALVVEAKDATDFGWHLEFDRVKFREIWAGD